MTRATAVVACNCGRGCDLARPEPLDQPGYDYRRRTDERVFDAPVTSVHAVLGRAEQRCWVEREQVQEDRGGRNVGGGTSIRDVRRCETASNGPPEYWDVSYRFRNVEHRIQMTSPPGRTIVVNRDGEPRQ